MFAANDGYFYTHDEFETESYLLVAVQTGQISGREAAVSLAELRELALSADAEVHGEMTVRVRQVDARTYVGRGHAAEIRKQADAQKVKGVIFDEDFSAVQQRNLEQELGRRVIGRTELILDIFAHRAQTHEGKLQVELAQLEYLRPRLVGQGLALSRLGGGIGTRGPGESKLEMDRRRIAGRISHLRRELSHVRKTRQTQRKKRLRHEVPTIALVGYTNAGKSTLLKALTQAEVRVENRLFATLDPAAKRGLLPDGRVAVFTDTVGFIHRLPTSLVEAFKATLEEVLHADLLLHVIDAASPTLEREVRTTEMVLKELGAQDKPVLRVFNKIDQNIDQAVFQLLDDSRGHEESVAISALYGIGIQDLLQAVALLTLDGQQCVKLRIPYARFDLLARLHAGAKVHRLEYEGDAVEIEAEVDQRLVSELEPYITTTTRRTSKRT